MINWKRVQGADGKLQGRGLVQTSTTHVRCFKFINNFFYLAFGFCEYVDPETGLRAIRLLHDLSFGDKNLVVSCAIV